MIKTVSPDKSSDPRSRGAIQRGETGDKVLGFHPAAADASSQSTGEQELRREIAPIRANDSNASSRASGLRVWASGEKAHPANGTAQMREGPAYMIWWFIIALVVIGYFAITWVWQ